MVTRAVRLGTRRADDENYDPFLLVLRDIETGKEQILPTFWAYGKSTTERGGQFPLLLSFEEWKTLFSQLDASFRQIEERIRLRAYELYERRGRGDGHALDDWLQAEAELRGQKAPRAAAYVQPRTHDTTRRVLNNPDEEKAYFVWHSPLRNDRSAR